MFSGLPLDLHLVRVNHFELLLRKKWIDGFVAQHYGHRGHRARAVRSLCEK